MELTGSPVPTACLRLTCGDGDMLVCHKVALLLSAIGSRHDVSASHGGGDKNPRQEFGKNLSNLHVCYEHNLICCLLIWDLRCSQFMNHKAHGSHTSACMCTKL